jgi:isoleucyl-tRNA synthetase
LRKDSGLDVTDRIVLKIASTAWIQEAIEANMTYICSEVLANEIVFGTTDAAAFVTDLAEEGDTRIDLLKI